MRIGQREARIGAADIGQQCGRGRAHAPPPLRPRRRPPMLPSGAMLTAASGPHEPAMYGCNGVPACFQASATESIQIHAASTRSEEHTSELQSLMRISYAVFCLKKKKRS